MEGIQQEGSQVKEEHEQHIVQPMPSIQVLPEQDQRIAVDGALTKKDKKVPIPPSVNNFIQKTYAILQEKQFQSIVSWADNSEQLMPSASFLKEEHEEGESRARRTQNVSSFKIHNLRAFQEIVLPKYFKHSNMSSFVRQLNMYSFHKVRGDKNEIEFQHEKFMKNRPDLLHQIKRKQVDSTTSIPSIALISQPPSSQILRDVEQLSNKEIKKDLPLLIQQNESPEKIDSAVIAKNEEQEELRCLREAQEANRSLKKLRQAKINQIKQLNLENKAYIQDKFNKFIFSLLAGKIQEEICCNDTLENRPKSEQSNLESIHKIIDHIMDGSQPKSFQEYLRMSQKLLTRKQEESN